MSKLPSILHKKHAIELSPERQVVWLKLLGRDFSLMDEVNPTWMKSDILESYLWIVHDEFSQYRL